MRIKLLLLALIINTCLNAQLVEQFKEVPSILTQYHNDFLMDVQNHLGISQHNAWTHGAELLESGKFSVSLNTGYGYIPHLDLHGFQNRDYPSNSHFTGELGSWYLQTQSPQFHFYILDPNTDLPVINATTGAPLKATIPLLEGTRKNFGNIPVITPRFRVGLGFNTEVGFSIMPGMYSAAYNGSSKLLHNDLYWGISFRHDVSYWLPELQKRKIHATIGYIANYNIWDLTIDDNIRQIGINDQNIIINTTIDNVEQTHSSHGLDLAISRCPTPNWEYYVTYAYVNSQVVLRSDGALNIRFPDFSNLAADREVILSDLFHSTKTIHRNALSVGCNFKIHKFSFGGKYSLQGSHLFSAQIAYHLNSNKRKYHKKEITLNKKTTRVRRPFKEPSNE